MTKKLLSVICVLGLLFNNSPAFAAEDNEEIQALKNEIQVLREDYEQRMQKLQSQIETLSQRQDQKITEIEQKVAENTLNVDYVGRYQGPFQKGGLLINNPSGFGNVSVGGYMDHEFLNFENSNSTFDQHRWIINIGAELGERLRFYSEYEIEHGGPDANNSGDGEAKVEQAWVDYLIQDWVNVRMGAVLVPMGRYNIYHDSDLQDLTDRPIVSRDVIPTTWTESGAGLHGKFNPTIGEYDDLIIGYETYVINGLDNGFSDTGLGGGRGSLKSDNNNSKAAVGRLTLSPALGHEVGFSGYWGRYNSAGDAITGGAVDWLTTWGPLELLGEYATFDVDEPVGGNVTDSLEGYYVQANYHFWPEFFNDTFLGRSFDSPTFTLVSRYDWAKIADDIDAGTGDNEEDRFTLGLNYRPVESWVFKMEYQFNHTKNEALERGSNNGFIASVAMGF